MKIVLLVVLLTAVAQILPSCGGEAEEVVGWVEEKYEQLPRSFIVINHVSYSVPRQFWLGVAIGDLVKYDGTQWTIVKKASGAP